MKATAIDMGYGYAKATAGKEKMTTTHRKKTGFFIADNVIFDRKDLSANEKLVYLYFCRRSNSENKAWPSYQRIADDSGLSRRTVIDVIKKLVNKNLLKKNTRSQQSNVYTLLPVPNYNTGSGLNTSSEINAPGGCNYCTRVEQGKMTTTRRRKTGFFIADNVIFDRKDLSANEKLVYLYFCRRANSENKAWPSYQRIADDSGLSRRTVIDVIKKLINKNLLKKNTRLDPSGNHASNEYTLLPVANYNTGSGLNTGSEVDALGSEINTPGGCNYYTRVVQEMHPKNTQNKNTQNKNTQNKNIQEKKERVSVCHDHDRHDTSNFLQSKTNNQLCKKINTKASNQLRRKINKPSLEKEIQKLGATPEQIERARQRMEEYKKTTGTVIRNIERYFLATLKNLIKFEKITGINTNKRKPSYERDREYRKKVFEALLMS
ncbi:helix-turn-helix domain-containing protein [Peptococcaceae bacterium]|nr:helix-turn-helix domain-containing protein [Peptococcaceae bacterium]